jgi:prepilin signal peptidase PulO-like enzyme (type II secretory pathway)
MNTFDKAWRRQKQIVTLTVLALVVAVVLAVVVSWQLGVIVGAIGLGVGTILATRNVVDAGQGLIGVALALLGALLGLGRGKSKNKSTERY